jgi:hypothetical protein
VRPAGRLWGLHLNDQEKRRHWFLTWIGPGLLHIWNE